MARSLLHAACIPRKAYLSNACVLQNRRTLWTIMVILDQTNNTENKRGHIRQVALDKSCHPNLLSFCLARHSSRARGSPSLSPFLPHPAALRVPTSKEPTSKVPTSKDATSKVPTLKGGELAQHTGSSSGTSTGRISACEMSA